MAEDSFGRVGKASAFGSRPAGFLAATSVTCRSSPPPGIRFPADLRRRFSGCFALGRSASSAKVTEGKTPTRHRVNSNLNSENPPNLFLRKTEAEILGARFPAAALATMIKTIKKLPYYLRKAPEKLKLAYRCMRSPYFRWVGPGHFYSPFPDLTEVDRRAGEIYPPHPLPPAAIDLRLEPQLQLLRQFEKYYSEMTYENGPNPRRRYYSPNGAFPIQDAFILHAMIRHFQPKRFIEVGCGFSSCMVLDTLEALQWPTRLTFVEPYPELLLKLVRPQDRAHFELLPAFIQDVPLDLFAGLEADDILFIDTSHVSKIGSDVNHIFFQILPALPKGVLIHFHDIWYPFEYSRDWLEAGAFWNEAYLLRAFLMFNPSFEIVLFNSHLSQCAESEIRQKFPLFLDKNRGASLWLRRI